MSTNKDPFTVIAKRNLARFGKLLFDNETNEILGRTCSDWGEEKNLQLKLCDDPY